MRVTVCKSFEVSCAHYLPGHEGKCKNMHGHNYKVEITAAIGGQSLIAEGSSKDMVMDFYELKELFNRVIHEKVDHQYLNEVYPDMRPTSENLAMKWLEELREKDSRIVGVRVWESSSGWASADLEESDLV